MVLTFENCKKKVNADLISYTGNGITIAVLDSGISDTHSLLKGKILNHYDLTGYGVGDIYGHGTAASSVIANIASGVKFLDIKVIGDDGTGDFSTIMQGVELAYENNAHMISMSIAGGQDCLVDSTFARFMDEIAKKGIMLVAAAGNDGPSQNPRLPALARKVISVGAMSEDGNIASFSSRGPACSRIYPDCSSYGVEMQVAKINGETEFMSGTSFSCPMVAGILACGIEKAGRTLLKEEVEQLLEYACIRIGTGKNNNSGWGKLDAQKVIDHILEVKAQTVTESSKIPLIIGGIAVAATAIALSKKK